MIRTGLRQLLLGLFLALLMSLPVKTLIQSGQASYGTRAEGEDITIVMNLTFTDPLHYSIEASVEVYDLYFREAIHNATSLRSILAAEGVSAKNELSLVLSNKVIGLANSSFSGDTITAGSSRIVEEGAGGGQLDDTAPILFRAALMGAVEVERFISSTKAAVIDESDRNELICAFLLSGFRFQRLMTLRSEPGITTTYIMPTTMVPYVDGAVTLNLRNTRVPPAGDWNILMVDGRVGVVTAPFDMQLTGAPPVRYSEEAIIGTTTLDWTSLDRMDLTSDLSVGSISTDRLDMDDVLPPSVMGPTHIGAGLIRLCILDGLLDQELISQIEGSVSEEISSTLETASGQEVDGLEVVLDAGTSGMPHPSGGEALLTLLRDGDPLHLDVDPKEPLEIEVSGGYGLDKVMGLLNGGLRLIRDFEPIDDEMTELEIVMPPGLTFHGETPERITANDRHVFDHEPGLRSLSSMTAPVYGSEKFSVDAVIDLSDVRSKYFLDAEVMVRCDIDIGLGRMAFDPADIELNTTLDYELDHLNSDVIRLLLEMGVIDRRTLEDRIRREVSDLLSPFVEAQEQDIVLTISDDNLVFDGDIAHMDDSVPLRISAHVEGISEPFGTTSDNGGGPGTGNVFVKRHWNPLVPFKTVKRTISMEEAAQWDSNVKVIFPSGCGVRAWLSNGSQLLDDELEVKVEGAYPSLYVEGGNGTWDSLHLELTMSGWFGFNNVLACFATTIGTLAILIVLLLVMVLKKLRKAQKGPKEERPEKGGLDQTEGSEDDDLRTRKDQKKGPRGINGHISGSYDR